MNAVAVSGGVVYALPGYDENKPLALNALTGVLLNPLSAPFEANTSWEQVGAPVAAGDRLYFSGGEAANTLYALNTQITDQALAYVWPSSPTLGAVSGLGMLSSPAMANELIYAGTVDGSLVAFSSGGAAVPLTANVIFSSPVYSSPGISNGMIIVADSGGRIVGYKAARTAAFSSPVRDTIVSGTAAVRGYVSNPNLTGYTLEYGAGEFPSAWTNVVSSVTVNAVENGVLAYWNTSDLLNGLYTLRLTAQGDAGSGAYNTAVVTVRVNAAPAAPSGLAAADVPGDTGNQIRLDWSASSSDGLTAYRIYRDDQGGALSGSVSSATLTYVDTSAVTGIQFGYRVRAYDGYAESPDSEPAYAAAINNAVDGTAPAAISDLAAAQSDTPGTVRLTWTATGNDGHLGTASRYIVKYASYDWVDFDNSALRSDIRPVEGPAGDNVGQEIGGLYGGVTYYFGVETEDFAANRGLSNLTSAWATIDLVPPQPPAGLAVTDTLGDDGNSLTLSWTRSPDDGAGYGDVYGYKLYRREQNGVYDPSAPRATLASGVAAYIDTAAVTNVRFYYSLSAFDSTNDSQLSGEASGISADNWRFFDASQGGTIKLADGARVDLPGNSASQNDNIMVSKLDPATYQPLAKVKANTQVRSTGIVYEIKFKNAATTLLKPAVLTLPYTDAAVSGMKQENLRLYTLSGGVWLMVNTSRPDTQAKKVTAEVNHFSIYSIMEYVPSGEMLAGDEVYTYPNPAKGASLTFKFKPSDKAYVKIDVYNIAGEKVARLEKQDCPAGVTSEIVWDIGRIASGVYQYKVEASGASGTKSIMKRLAVIH